jgi:hypothetical protein
MAAILDFLPFNDVSLLPKSGISHLCEDLNSNVGQGVSYNEYTVRNTQWLQIESDIVVTTNSDTVFWGFFSLSELYSWHIKLCEVY